MLQLTLQRVQLNYKSPCRESSAISKSPCRELSYPVESTRVTKELLSSLLLMDEIGIVAVPFVRMKSKGVVATATQSKIQQP